MPNLPKVQDARLILQLCNVRRDDEMRKARLWWRNPFGHGVRPTI